MNKFHTINETYSRIGIAIARVDEGRTWCVELRATGESICESQEPSYF